MRNTVYKIEDASVWASAQALGSYSGSPLDVADGFIHLSAVDQVRETADKWFTGREGLVLVHVNSDALGEALKWEASRDGALFPHNYGPLAMSAVLAVEEMTLNRHGRHVFGPHIV